MALNESTKLGFVLLALFTLSAFGGEHGSDVWIGEDVTEMAPKSPAAHFCADGTVVIYVGALIPGVRDAKGNPVRIKRIEVRK